MTDKPISISVKNISKKFHLYDSPAHRFKEVVHPFRKKYHHDFWALKDISFDVMKGEMVGFVGANGSGKSTLLQIISKTLTPTAGEVTVNGRVSALLELGTGFNPEFSGKENVYMNGAIIGLSRKEMDARFEEIVDFADIGEFIHQPVKKYSSGMYVRLAFAVAISVEPDILIVDEALSVGDMQFQAKCMFKIKQLMDKNVTIVFVSHDIAAIKSLCSKCLYLKSGIQKKFGPAHKVIESYYKEMKDEMYKEMPESSLPQIFPPIDETDIQANSHRSNGTVPNVNYRESANFLKQVEMFRSGSGEAKVTNAELLNESGESIQSVNFNQKVKIRLHIYFYSEVEVAVGYEIRDDKFINILASDIVTELDKTIHGKPGDKYVIDFESNLPICDGNYNILVLLQKPIILNRSSKIIDYIENSIVFNITERKPYKIWSKIYLKNNVYIWKHAD